MATKEQLKRRKEIKDAKRDWKETLRLNPVGYQEERLKLHAHAIDVKSKSKVGHNYEMIDSNRELVSEFEGKKQSINFTFNQYQGNYSLGYVCKLQLYN